MNLIPPDDRVILRQLPAETRTAFGLELPEQAREHPLRATVLAVGRGTLHPTGEYQGPTHFDPVIGDAAHIPLGLYWQLQEDYDDDGAFVGDAWYLVPIEPGDEVVIPRYGGTEIESEEGETLISILASEVLAVVS